MILKRIMLLYKNASTEEFIMYTIITFTKFQKITNRIRLEKKITHIR